MSLSFVISGISNAAAYLWLKFSADVSSTTDWLFRISPQSWDGNDPTG